MRGTVRERSCGGQWTGSVLCLNYSRIGNLLVQSRLRVNPAAICTNLALGWAGC